VSLEASGVVSEPGVVLDDDGPSALGKLSELLGAHRVWDRFPVTVRS